MTARYLRARIVCGFVAVAAVVVNAAILQAPVSAADPLGALECLASPQIFMTKPDKVMDLDLHHEPESGGASWAGRQAIGSGWDGTVKVGPDGWVYLFMPTGDVRRYHWLGNSWADAGEVIQTGWTYWGTVASRNKMTVDKRGDFYGIAADNALHLYRYDAVAKTWSDRVLANDWGGRFDFVVAAGPGVVYAREVNGDLYRAQYDTVSQRLSTLVKVGVGWQSATDITSPGGDVLYMVEGGNQALRWYRYLGDQKWTPDSGHNVGGGIPADWQLEFQPDGCKLTPDGTPTRPTVTKVPKAAASLTYTAAKRLYYSYVDNDGNMVNAQAEDVSGTKPIGFSGVPGFTGLTGVPSAVDLADGRVRLVGLGQDAETRSSTQIGSPAGNWAAPVSVGGFTTGPVAVGRAGGVVYGYGVDAKGCLWRAYQRTATAELGPWELDGCDGYAQVAPTVMTSGSQITVTLLKTTGTYSRFAHSHPLQAAVTVSLGGSGFTGPASTIINGAGKVQTFARDTDGQVYTQIGSPRPGQQPTPWTAIPGLTVAGPPSAVLSPTGTIEIVARGTDNRIYNTGQQASGSPAYRPWREITDGNEVSSTDPTAVALPDKGMWVIAFRNEADVPKLRRTDPSTPTRQANGENAPIFVDVPVQAAR
ncbi:tachylectin-related carbohydrate-binding protein [Kibdelosporangium phytohabitans]|uniref:tachylectin-related carbohydrate-binding protein n=1 Tax=Kibdelosporangium phytohabitans TaxID=860235 RepID=UPI00147017C0|nr:tachylectin-related carbohydrate-binding protein [Kibdelosporangium phytohabitans]